MASTPSPSSSLSPGLCLATPPRPHEHQQQQQPLYGRRKESKLLLEAYARCRRHDNNKAAAVAATTTTTTTECVLITGASGMGKTTLVQRVLRPKVLSDGGLFLSGKFEVSPHYQPYEVIASTLAQLADQLLLVPGDDRLEEIQIALSETLGDEIWMLQDVIPGLERILECDVSVEGKSSSGVVETMSTESSSLSRFHFVFCEFCRAVAAMVPLVIFLDDMQWCDQASLELIQALLRPKLAYASSDSSLGMPPSSASLLLIVVSRDDDQEVQHPIHGASSTTLQDGNNHNCSESPHHFSLVDTFLNGSMPSRSITRIHLTSLSKDETSDFLEHNCGFTKETAKVVAPRAFDKCSGNILYTLQYMRSLCKDCELMNNEEKVMDSSHNHDDDDDDEAQETVETLILRRIHKLPIFTQELLQMAGCMGNVINEEALAMVTDSTALEISQALETAAKEDLVELVPRRRHYRFIHDSVRQTVLSMIADQEEMAFRIGYQLWKKSSSLLSTPKDANLFTIVNLLNKGVVRFMTDRDERYQVAELNLIAGRRAASKVSFRDASRYCNAGIEFITTAAGAAEDCWNDRYDLSLQLYSAAASAELSNHIFTRVYELIEEIFKHARCFQDKLNAHACQIVATGQQGKVADATNLGLAVLEQLGEKVLTTTEVEDRPTAFLETERVLRGKSNADILSLPYMDDEEKLETMRFLVMLIPYTIQAGSSYANWIAARIVHLTLSYGLSRGCAHGFSSYARFVCASNARLGCQYGELAVMIVQKCGNKELMPRVYVSIYAFTSLWTRPLRESLSPLQTAFEVAVENGDVEYALIAAFFRTLFSLYVGMNLVQVEQLLKETRRQLNFYKQDLWLNFTNCALQFVINLTSKTQHPQMLAGDVCSLQDRDFIDNSSVSYVFHGFSSKLAYLFGDFDLADQYARILLGLSSRVPYTSYWFALNQFQIGLIAIAQVHRGIQPERNVEVAQRCVKKMVGWARDCPDNFLNKKSLLDAELESLNSSGSVDPKVISLYNQAIEGALEEGYLDEAAIACERAGDYLHRNKDTVEARRFWNQAQRLFRRWGATSKAEALRPKRSV